MRRANLCLTAAFAQFHSLPSAGAYVAMEESMLAYQEMRSDELTDEALVSTLEKAEATVAQLGRNRERYPVP